MAIVGLQHCVAKNTISLISTQVCSISTIYYYYHYYYYYNCFALGSEFPRDLEIRSKKISSCDCRRRQIERCQQNKWHCIAVLRWIFAETGRLLHAD
jgi:hypothetical protein